MKNALLTLLTPIARLCVAKGIGYPELADILKQAFVLAATDRIDGKVTDSRLSVMTGLQRRDIVRLRSDTKPKEPPPNPMSRIVAAWVAAGGKPMTKKAFGALASKLRKDIHPATILSELIATGTVSLDGADQVTLQKTSFQPLPGTDAQLDYLASNGRDFLAAATGNVITTPAPFFERAAHYNGLSEKAVAELDARFRAAQMQVLEQISNAGAALQKTSPGNHRFRAGGYFFKEEQPCSND